MAKLKHGELRYLCKVQREWQRTKPAIPGHWAEAMWYQPDSRPGFWKEVWRDAEQPDLVDQAMKNSGPLPAS